MPCSCEGFPPSPCYGDLIGTAEAAMQKIDELETELAKSEIENIKLKSELEQLKAAFKIVGNGG